LFYQAPQGTIYVNACQQAVLKGQILISLPNTESNSQRKVCVELFFGKSERKARAYNESNPDVIYEVTLEGTKKKKVQYHVIFVIDHSGSMADSDVVPKDPEFVSSNKNRLGAVFEATSSFLKTRMDKEPSASVDSTSSSGRISLSAVQNRSSFSSPTMSPIKLTMPTNTVSDIYSMIKFDNTASIVFEKQPLSPNLKNDFTFKPEGGTVYCSALEIVKTYLKDDSIKNYIPMVIFLSDGEDSNQLATLQCIEEMKKLSTSLIINTIHFGSDPSGGNLLKKMANSGNGLFVPVGASLEKLILTFELMAMKI